jgi:hypothetical protein
VNTTPARAHTDGFIQGFALGIGSASVAFAVLLWWFA